ncbi:hypothetical protein pEaSNUABM14_00327 [Erwinia phage pEa_SNUABM_14]|uniref:Uncharacterized protein n=1 Tax=Erwinia phage pEa_SNUABM_7 TaxID=2866695 RepID=A0AAE7WSL2_9CAUD|nr:hypothetical protein MPK74_gp330 [Erwinia phage pEa_SNUABM_7]QYW04652.1 hypothetical protein pEaSNUABM14_00327 [Erwinia phage pEa_SNUABM_14]QYW04998.1 hypothetical protein pEaSNUABM7_00330 [Erwinia phage pEa_SNUABM_7]
MSENNQSGATRFGTEVQAGIAEAQRRANSAESGKLNKCTIIVLTSIDANQRYSYLSADEQLREELVRGKVINRLPDLLERAGGNTAADNNSAFHILHPNNGVPTSIDARIKVGEGNAVILSYTVNKAVTEMHGSLSLALFASGAEDLNDLAADFGIHAIAIVEESKAAEFIKGLEAQVEALNIVNLTSIDDSNDSLDLPVIDFAALAGNPTTVLTGAVRTFIMQSISGEVFAAIPNNGELNVKNDNVAQPADLEEDFDNNDEIVDQNGGEGEVTGEELLGYKAENLSLDQMRSALEAINYDLSEMTEEAIREAFETEQNLYLGGGDDESSEEEEDEDATDVDSDEEEEEEDEEFDAPAYLAQALAAENFSRSDLKLLVKSQDLKVMKNDTPETLVQKLLDLVQDASSDEVFELITVFVELLDEHGVECDALRATIAEDESDEDEEEDGEDEDADEDGDDEEEEDEEESDEDESETESDDEPATLFSASDVTDPLDYFQFEGGDLTHEQRAAAVQAMGSSTVGLNIVQVMKAFNQIRSQSNAIDIAADEADSALYDMLTALPYATLLSFAQEIELDVDGEESAEDLVTLLMDESTADSDTLKALAYVFETYGGLGVEADDILLMDWHEALALVIPVYASSDEVESDAEEDEDEDVIADEDSSNANLKFLKSVDVNNPVGPMLEVDMDRTLVINYTFTDGNTYRDVQDELADIGGVNYRFPFNLGKAGKANKSSAPGSLIAPAEHLIAMLDRAGTTRFLADPNTFDVGVWAESLERMLNAEIANNLYAGRIEDGADPQQAGIVVGDFIDEDEQAEVADLGLLDEDELEAYTGDHLPIASLYNAQARVRPVNVDSSYVALSTVVLNVAVPGFWCDSDVGRLVQACVNRVISLAESVEGIKVYAGFTLESAALLNNGRLYEVVGALREMDGVQSYSAADAANFSEAEDIIEVASSIDDRDLPFTVLASGLSGATFENGGDLTVLVPCSVFDEEEDESEEDESEEDEE